MHVDAIVKPEEADNYCAQVLGDRSGIDSVMADYFLVFM